MGSKAPRHVVSIVIPGIPAVAECCLAAADDDPVYRVLYLLK